MSSRMIRLRSAEGQNFEADEKAAAVSQTLRHMIEDGMADGDKVIPLPNVTSATLSKVLEYCRKHADGAAKSAAGDSESSVADAESESESESEAAVELKAWDAEFVKVADWESLFELINAANYLHIKDLQELTCQVAAEMIKDKPVEEVREIFNIENDYTEEEEAELRRANAWAFQ